jgi:hypothetical protein
MKRGDDETATKADETGIKKTYHEARAIVGKSRDFFDGFQSFESSCA